MKGAMKINLLEQILMLVTIFNCKITEISQKVAAVLFVVIRSLPFCFLISSHHFVSKISENNEKLLL